MNALVYAVESVESSSHIITAMLHVKIYNLIFEC